MLKIPNKMKGVINVLMAVFTPNLVMSYINQYGLAPIYHSYFQDRNHYQNGWGHNHYGFKRGNIYLEQQHIKDIRKKAIRNITEYIKLENQILDCHYNIQELKHTQKNPTKSRTKLYTLLITGKDGKIGRDSNNKPIVIDKQNRREIYSEYNSLKRKLSQYINRHSNNRALLLKLENPWHYKHLMYTHPHIHGVISIINARSTKRIENKARELFRNEFGYEPVICHIQPLYKSLKRTINYFLTDGKIQTKDTNPEYFKGIHSKLRMNQLHLAFNAQLNSSKGHRVAYYVAISTLKSMKKKLNKLENKLTHLINKINNETELALKPTTIIIKQTLLNKKEHTFSKQAHLMNICLSIATNDYENYQYVLGINYSYNSIKNIKNYSEIKQNKRANQSHFHNKYKFRETDLPP